MPRSWSASRRFPTKSAAWPRTCCSTRRQDAGRIAATAPEDWREQTREQKIAINQFHIAAITDISARPDARKRQSAAELPLDQRLANYIIEGTKDGLIPDLDLKRQEGAAPLDIINGPLMAGMTEVGRLFNNNELIVAEVLQSAEAMKAAVNHLEQFMEKADTAARGKIVLATVKGDVHDIGKNLVEIILANNGYEVINLGIKVPPDALDPGLARAPARCHRPLRPAGQERPPDGDHRVRFQGQRRGRAAAGGRRRALREVHHDTHRPAYGAPTFYAKDAMTGLRMMNELMDPATREAAAQHRTYLHGGRAVAVEAAPAVNARRRRSPKVRTDIPIPPAPYLDRRVRDVPQPQRALELHQSVHALRPASGLQRQFRKDCCATRDPKALELYHDVEAVKQEAAKFMKVRAVWQFFEAERDGNSDPSLRARAPRVRCTPSISAGSRNPTASA